MNIVIITGSTLGYTEEIAENVSSLIKNKKINTTMFHGGKKLDILKNYDIWLIITSTYGDGNVPDNLQYFFNEIKCKKILLPNVKFGAIGIGSTKYDTFCRAIDLIASQLIKLQATMIYKILKIDSISLYDQNLLINKWVLNWLKLIKNN
ncbi:MAG: flavodoxin domain-containing protein [Enterobacterales bacterium]